jgi:6-phosphogluconolactonase (cycloisomerase 2 family)
MNLHHVATAAIVVAAALSAGRDTLRAQPPASTPPSRTVLYAAVGSQLTRYDVDVQQATLTRQGSVSLPANVQEVALPPSRRLLHVGWSNVGASYGSAPVATTGHHGLTTFRIDPQSGELTPHGAVAPLRARPIHLTTDNDGAHVIVAYNEPSGVTVHRLEADGTVGPEVPQRDLDGGIYGHHVRVTPSGRTVVLVTRGNVATPRTAEDPGALKVFRYSKGGLTNRASIAPKGGYGFQARHIDFHPSQPWAFVTLEAQNAINMFRLTDDSLAGAPLFSKTTLAEPQRVRPGQTTSSIHVHPNGRFVYVGNRASATVEASDGLRVAAGGENTIAVFSIDQKTGEPTLIQTADTHGYHPRTFALDDSGQLLVVGNINSMTVRTDNGSSQVPATLAVFRIGADGRLTFVRTYAVDVDPVAGRLLFWMGMVGMSAQ